MKKNKGSILSAIFSFTALFIIISGITVLADDTVPSNVILDGNANGIVFIPGDELFLENKDMLPGDTISRSMTIRNRRDDSYKLYLRAEKMTEDKEDDLFNVLSLKITYKGKIIYEGNASGIDGMSSNIDLGIFNPGDVKELQAQVNFDKNAGNEYKNKIAKVNWIFTAVGDNENIEKPVNNYIQTTKNINTPVNNIITKFKTGDPFAILFLVIFMLCFLLASYFAIKGVLNRRGRNERN